MDHRPFSEKPVCETLIVGGGTAGCVLAHALVRGHGQRVTLIEAGGPAQESVYDHRPAHWIRLLGSDQDWALVTESTQGIAGRRLVWPRGRGLGGSSRINAMIWFEPTAVDFARWRAASGGRWSFDQLRQSLAEVRECVRPESPRWLSQSASRFLAAAESLTQTSQVTGRPMIYLRCNREGRRWTPASLLGKLADDERLRIVRATVDRIAWDRDRAVGVVVQSGSSQETIRCDRQLILCGGAIATPAILMRSGIGPRDALTEHRIKVRVELGGVGRNLADHLVMPVVFGLRRGARFPTETTPRDLARWQALGTGPLASNLAECGGLFADDQLQLHVTPTHYLSHPTAQSPAAMTIGVNVTDPKSRGRLTLRSPRAADVPLIEPGYLSEPADLSRTVEGVHLARQIAGQSSLTSWITQELVPGAKRVDESAVCKAIARYSQTLYHPTGTCTLGTGDNAVVDANLSVRGLENVAIVDASVFPNLATGNPQAAVMTLATHYTSFLMGK